MFEPVNPGWSTPAWGEFGAWRVHGRHQGIDYYVPRGTPLWASGDGVVEAVAFHAGGHGHFVTIRYDAGYRVSVSHMLNRSPLTPGQRVNARTRIGTVGQTGNAEGIVWEGLIHPHVEVRRVSNNLLQNPRQILKPFDRTSLANSDPDPSQEDTMPRLVKRTEGTPEWSLFDPSFSGPSPLERGYYTITDPAEALDWARLLYRGANTEQQEPRSVYIRMQASARNAHAAYLRSQPSAGGSTGLKPVLDAIANVPTAEQNGQAARNAIVK